MSRTRVFGVAILLALAAAFPAAAQLPPGRAELDAYRGLHAAAARDDAAEIARLAGAGADLDARDAHGRTALHVAAFLARHEAMRALVSAGAEAGVLEADRYDTATIAAVRDDAGTLRLALALGADPRAITSRFDGTALIAAAHLGHVDCVRILVAAGARLDHVNNLGWTALMEAVVLGDGGPRHAETVRVLVEAGVNVDLPDRQGVTPLSHARRRGYADISAILSMADTGERR